MGNQQALLNHGQELSFVQDFNNQIIEKGTQNHPYLGKINLWEITNSNRKKIFSKNYHVAKQNTEFSSIHLQRCSMKHPNLLNYYACIKKTQKLLRQVETYEFYFEYIPMTLNQLIKKGALQEVQIWMIIEQVTDFMAYLQTLNRNHGNLTSEAIFMEETNKIKLLDQFMQNSLKQNKIKDDVHDFGLLILEMMTQRVSWLNFSNCLKGLIGQYSLQLLQFTGRLLKQDIDGRPDFFEIKTMIKNRFNVPITLQEFTQVESIPHVQQNVQIISSEQLAQYQIIQQQNQVIQKNAIPSINNIQQLQSQILKTQPDHQCKQSNQNLYMKTLPDQSLNKTNILQKNISLQTLDFINQQQAITTDRNQEPKIMLKQGKFGQKRSVEEIPQSYLFNQQYTTKRKVETQQTQNQISKSISLNQTQNTTQQETQVVIRSQETKPQYNSPVQIKKNNMDIQQITSRLVMNSPQQPMKKLYANASLNSDVSTIPTLQSQSIVQQQCFQHLQYSSNQKSYISQYQEVKTRSFQKNQYQ